VGSVNESSRRAFLASMAGGFVSTTLGPGSPTMAGRRLGASRDQGHRLRDEGFVALRSTEPSERVDVVVVGGGVSGLAAAWRFAAAGVEARILELEPFIGGTSTWGEEGVVPHPFGAHYLPAPNPEARPALRLLEQMGVLTGYDAAGRATFDPRVLCHSPQERIFYRGQWHPDLVPHDALSKEERGELARFKQITDELTLAVGSDGRPAFTIPVGLSSRDPALLALDRMTMRAWLDREGFVTEFLRWYVRYATLDDFGGEPEEVSAWAGLHYFASRKTDSPELSGSHFLVWPEGNGRLVRALSESVAPVRTGALVSHVELTRGGVSVTFLDVHTDTVQRVEARAAVIATPGFVARRCLSPELASRVRARVSSPWVVANLHVRRPVDPDRTWDSVLYDSVGLGYVDASHQLTAPTERSVLTYFRAFGGADVGAARAALAGQSWEELVDGVFHDLAPAHPHLVEDTARVDLMVWGHAMPRPTPGFLGGGSSRTEPAGDGPRLAERVAWAHVDQSGMALFEEAITHGVNAAEALMPPLGLPVRESWS
jgi:monoamine oxidase